MKHWIQQWRDKKKARAAQGIYSALRAEAKALSNFHAGRKVLESLLEQLDVERFDQSRSTNGIGQVLPSLYPTIDAYHHELKIIKGLVAREVALSPQWSVLEVQPAPLSQFFTSRDGYYLDAREALSAFREDALILCRLMQASDTAEFGVHEHNLRMLTKFFVNLRQITLALCDLSFPIEA